MGWNRITCVRKEQEGVATISREVLIASLHFPCGRSPCWTQGSLESGTAALNKMVMAVMLTEQCSATLSLAQILRMFSLTFLA